MQLATRDFGTVEIEESDIITFKQPLYGFETLTRYVILFDQSAGSRFVWLQSVEDKDICFILVEPGAVIEDYEPQLPAGTKGLLGEGELLFWLVAVISDRFENSTVNLKSPVVVNVNERVAAQIILEESRPDRYPLVGNRKERRQNADTL